MMCGLLWNREKWRVSFICFHISDRRAKKLKLKRKDFYTIVKPVSVERPFLEAMEVKKSWILSYSLNMKSVWCMYREVSCDLNVNRFWEKIDIIMSSLFVESEGFEGKIGGYKGKERNSGSSMISFFFMGGGGVSLRRFWVEVPKL